MIAAQAVAPDGELLTEQAITQALTAGLAGRFTNQRVLVLIPDFTRSLPLHRLFRALVEILHGARQLDFMVALGTHPPLSEERLNELVGISAGERRTVYGRVGLLNHAWDDPAVLTQIGVIAEDELRAIAGDTWHPSLAGDVPVRINKAALEYDQIIILGPTFPHEVVGFSGGVKYLFPGISGPEMIHKSHWLGALATVRGTIGNKATPARAMIHRAAAELATPVTLAAVVGSGQALSGVFVGDPLDAWEAAVEQSSQRHIQWFDRPFQRVLSCCPPMYDDLWTGGKAMYKVEPAVAMGGELIIYAPHLEAHSITHGKTIAELGYHVLPYFLEQWERFEGYPLGIIAHSTQLRGSGRMENGVEQPNVRLVLASKIPEEECTRMNLGYRDPASIDFADWQGREEDGVLFVPKAGEVLYRAREG